MISVGILSYIVSIGYGVYYVMRNNMLGMLISLGMLLVASMYLGVYA